MKKMFITTILGLLVLTGCSQTNLEKETKTAPTLNQYLNEGYGISFNYPSGIIIISSDPENIIFWDKQEWECKKNESCGQEIGPLFSLHIKQKTESLSLEEYVKKYWHDAYGGTFDEQYSKNTINEIQFIKSMPKKEDLPYKTGGTIYFTNNDYIFSMVSEAFGNKPDSDELKIVNDIINSIELKTNK